MKAAGLLFCFMFLFAEAVLYAGAVTEGDFSKSRNGDLPFSWKVFSGEKKNISVVRAKFENYQNAVKILPVPGRESGVIFRKTLRAVKGDTLLIECVFKTTKGQKVSFGFRDPAGKEQQLRTFAAYSSSWDRRTFIVPVRESSTRSVCAVLCTAGGKSPVLFSYINIRRLTRELADLYSPEKDIARFRTQTAGNNLALRGKVSFNPEPVYELTKSNTDNTELIDGKLSRMTSLWFDRKAVGFTKAFHGTSITVDLGKVCDVGNAVIRLQGGRIYSYTISFPDVLEVWVSKNGRDYYKAAAMTKLKSTESSMSNWKDLYYLPETIHPSGIPYVYTFTLPVMAQARFVTFRDPVYKLRSFFSDELAVMEATPVQKKAPEWNSVYKKPSYYMNHNSVMIYPAMECFYVSEGIRLPNYLRIENLMKNPKGTFAYEIEFPSVVKYTPDNSWPAQTRILEKVEKKGNRVTYRFRSGAALNKFMEMIRYGLGPFYFYVEKGVKIPVGEDYVLFTSYYNGKKALTVKRRLAAVAIPEMRLPEKLDVSLWLEERFMMQPDHIESLRKCGFTSSMFFPRKAADLHTHKALYDRAENRNFKIRLELEPVNTLRWKYPNVTEYRCVGAEKNPGSVCLAYRGKYYLQTVAEVKAMLKVRKIHAVTFDIEAWEPHNMNTAMRCSRCKALKEKKGYSSWVEYLTKEQFEYVKAYTQAVREGAAEGGHKVPHIGYYAMAPGFAYRCMEGPVPFLGFPYLYPAYADELQASCYDRSTVDCHKKMRSVFKNSAFSARRIPWLSAGTGAYYTTSFSYRNEQHVLETLMNGALGLQFYSRKSFESPLDYYYVARGIGAVAPYEDFLFKGTLEEQIRGNNKDLCYTVRRLGKEYLILAGNYENRTEVRTEMVLPGKIRSVRMISGNGKALSSSSRLSLRIGGDSFVLLKVSL